MSIEISEIQDMVFRNLNNLKPCNTNELSLLDYFVSRQYIQLFNVNFLQFALEDLSDRLIQFADLIDTSHPEVVRFADGLFNLSSDFSKFVLEILDIADLGQTKNLPTALSVLRKAIRRQYAKSLRRLNDVPSYIRLLKDAKARENVRFVSARKDIQLDLNRPKMWHSGHPSHKTFKPYCFTSDYYGFCKISMTNAAIILNKLYNNYASAAQAMYPIKQTNLGRCKLGHLLDELDSFQSADKKPIFDRFWQIDIGVAHRSPHGGNIPGVLLGEREKTCYFIICW